MRPRLLIWLGSFIDAAAAADLLPRLRALAEALRDLLLKSRPDLLVPDYPAFARPGSVVVGTPQEWRPLRARPGTAQAAATAMIVCPILTLSPFFSRCGP